MKKLGGWLAAAGGAFILVSVAPSDVFFGRQMDLPGWALSLIPVGYWLGTLLLLSGIVLQGIALLRNQTSSLTGIWITGVAAALAVGFGIGIAIDPPAQTKPDVIVTSVTWIGTSGAYEATAEYEGFAADDVAWSYSTPLDGGWTLDPQAPCDDREDGELFCSGTAGNDEQDGQPFTIVVAFLSAEDSLKLSRQTPAGEGKVKSVKDIPHVDGRHALSAFASIRPFE